MKFPLANSGASFGFLPSSNSFAPYFYALSRIYITLSFPYLLFKGAMSVLSSHPGPILRFLTFPTNSSSTHFPESPTKTATEIAIHRWPVDPNAAPTNALIASYLSASGITIIWFFAPILHCALLPCSDAVLYIYSPALLDPTNETALTSGWVHIALTISVLPFTELTTPLGTPLFFSKSNKY